MQKSLFFLSFIPQLSVQWFSCKGFVLKTQNQKPNTKTEQKDSEIAAILKQHQVNANQ